MRLAKKTRRIKPEQILIGDTIRVSWKANGIAYTAVGKIATREHWIDGTYWNVDTGTSILFRDSAYRAFSAFTLALATVTLLDREADRATTLDGLDI